MDAEVKEKPKAIIFMDGNNFYHNLKAMGINPADVSFEKVVNFVCSHFNCTLLKPMFYNSIPSIEDVKETYYGHMRFLSYLERKGFEVIKRKLQR